MCPNSTENSPVFHSSWKPQSLIVQDSQTAKTDHKAPILLTFANIAYDQFQPSGNPELSRIVVFMSCEKPVNSPYCLDTSTCIHNSSNYISHSKRYSYIKVGKTNAAEVADLCRVEKITQTSWPRNDDPNISCKDVRNELVYGFEISWLRGNCQSICGRKFTKCHLNDTNHVQCSGKLNGG